MERTTREILYLVISSLFFCNVLWIVFRSIAWKEVREWMYSGVRWMSDRLFACKQDDTSTKLGPIEQYVKKQMDVLRARRMTLAYDVILGILSIKTLLICANLLSYAEHTSSVSKDALHFLGAFATSLPKYCSCLEPGKAVHISYGLAMIFCILHVWNNGTGFQPFMVAIRLSFVPCCLHVCEVASWNAIHFTVRIVNYAMEAAYSPNAIGASHMLAFLVPEVFVVVLLIGLNESFRGRAWSEKFQDAVETSGSLQYHALGTLMDHVCDVSLPLDDKFVISSDAKRFSALLMLDTRRSLQGMDILDFIPSKDEKERFRNAFACDDVANRRVVSCLNLELRESSGMSVRVEMIGVKYKGIDEVPNYIVGIRENAADRCVAPLRAARLSTLASEVTPPVATIGASRIAHPELGNQSGISGSTHGAPTTNVRDNRVGRQHPLPTGEQAKLQSMIELISLWSVIPSRRMCCMYHATLLEAKSVIGILRRGQCRSAFYDDALIQCGACGMLNPEDNDKCTLCNHDIPASKVAL
eukprot:TRINITY_DN55946_c0_g1_i1.p1 TRINITY_DN55946_c0_g1~~TRINITY_DN55946_c0_g1_i1.p1  ORF type:complete len:540 (+),score=41.74 TRINITY_DN55946_c0_g1_i1:37-1620(+)